ncbi:hypothetical protein GGD50_006452 [Rhizobium paranaense]|uniref:Uncharacterized protein n=1 Tax=Rhizobium paranaense TaxID=1650438 RepID=A0A7W8XYB4_9HYPH|nr:hypothetical protein [Rhizobium paranaense]
MGRESALWVLFYLPHIRFGRSRTSWWENFKWKQGDGAKTKTRIFIRVLLNCAQHRSADAEIKSPGYILVLSKFGNNV